MAKGKGSSGVKYISKGIVGVDSKLLKGVRNERSEGQKMLNKLEAFEKGKNVFITIDNPNPKETNKRRIRVPAKELYGDFKTWRNGAKALNS